MKVTGARNIPAENPYIENKITSWARERPKTQEVKNEERTKW